MHCLDRWKEIFSLFFVVVAAPRKMELQKVHLIKSNLIPDDLVDVVIQAKIPLAVKGGKCKCKNVENKCSEDCENAVEQQECPKSCGKKCKNRKLANGFLSVDGLEICYYKSKGWGVKLASSANPIQPGEFIVEYVGIVKAAKVFEKEFCDKPTNYVMDYADNLILDATLVGNVSRYMNHSCSPNAKCKVWRGENGLPRVMLVCSKLIEPGDEITYDNSIKLLKGQKQMECSCGKFNCKSKPPRRKPWIDLTCSTCSQKFSNSQNLKRHERAKHLLDKSNKFSCKTCAASFDRGDHFKRHLKLHEVRKRSYACTVKKCKKSFFSASNLKYHIRTTHATPKSIICGKLLETNHRCKRVFSSEKARRAHKAKH